MKKKIDIIHIALGSLFHAAFHKVSTEFHEFLPRRSSSYIEKQNLFHYVYQRLLVADFIS